MNLTVWLSRVTHRVTPGVYIWLKLTYIVPLVSAVAHLQPFRQCLYFSFIYYFRPAGNAGESDCRIHHFVGGIWGSAKTN